ncbi:aldose epimerase [Pannus brasiliensis CCIBt3594]|uniref:Aldose epimerase n=1 Tax=Pannus brasiliensis CCIBt3594 TaxID=1427578 RepID=A0AAW9QTP7_9CHRO
MFTVTRQQKQFLTYLLTDEDANSSVEVVPERGGILTRWQIRGQNILYLDAERFADPSLSVRGGIPILFPICGNLPDNAFVHAGKTYPLKQHGFARDLPWKVVGQDTDGSASLSIELTSDDSTRQGYPFDFQLVFTYQLQGNTLKIHQRFVNLSDKRMPFSIGFHPYFQVADKTALDFDIPATAYIDQRTKEIHPYTGGFDFSIDEIDHAYTEISRHTAGFSDRSAGRQINLGYDDLFTTLVFWTVKGKDYVCLEPWSGPRNALNTGEQVKYLEPRGTREAIFEIRVSEL